MIKHDISFMGHRHSGKPTIYRHVHTPVQSFYDKTCIEDKVRGGGIISLVHQGRPLMIFLPKHPAKFLPPL